MSETSLTVKSLTLLIEQGAPAVKREDWSEKIRCQYRTSFGLSCAVGILLPESEAEYLEKEAGGFGISSVVKKISQGELSGLSRETKTLLKENKGELSNLQDMHDTRAEMSPEDFTHSLKQCLEDFKSLKEA